MAPSRPTISPWAIQESMPNSCTNIHAGVPRAACSLTQAIAFWTFAADAPSLMNRRPQSTGVAPSARTTRVCRSTAGDR
jgi:hypothetical protein